MNQPLVSICIPSYNRADLIEETINSALSQTYTNIEVIVNDNCSTDGSWMLLQGLAKKDSRLKIFKNESNLGAVRNWKKVMSHATGVYALILWSDDLISNTFIEKTVGAFGNDIAFVMTGIQEFTKEGVYYSSNFGKEGKRSKKEYYDEVLFKNSSGFPVSPSCALFRTDDLRQNILDVIPNSDHIDFNLTGAGPDILTFFLTSLKYPYIFVLSEHLAQFRSHPASITMMESKIAGLKLHYDWAKYYFVKNHLQSYLDKFKAITWIRYYKYKKIHRNMLMDMKAVRTDYLFMISLFFKSMMSRRKILLTGATGFLGSNILKRIVNENDVAIITRDSSNLEKIQECEDAVQNFVLEQNTIDSIIKSFRPDVIIHCATDYGRKAVPQIQIIEANLILPLKLIHAASQTGLKMFINTDTFLDKGINHYSLSKRQFNDWFHTYSNEILCINMVLEHFYGPFDDKTKFVSFVISELLANKPEIQLTPGTQKRNFIFIDDVVEAFHKMLQHDFGRPSGFFDFFIASEQTVSIKELVLKLKELCGNETTKLNFGALPFRTNEVMDSSADISAMKQLGWTPQTNLDDGLRRTIQAEKNKAIKNL